VVSISRCSTVNSTGVGVGVGVGVGGFYVTVELRVLGVEVGGSAECWTPRVICVTDSV